MSRKAEKKLMATIDIGAHSARMLIAEVNVADHTFVELEELEMPVPLGSNVFRTAMIADESIQILCGILRNFKQKMDEYGVRRCLAIATSAVREAGNAEIFIERVRHATGIDIRIFDGVDEARLDYIATISDVPAKYGFNRKATLIADIGTGACQVSAYDCGQLRFTETLKVGTLRAIELMPGTFSSTAMVQFVSTLVDKSFSELEHISGRIKAETIIAMGSSVRTLLRLTGRRGTSAASLPRETFFRLRSEILNMSLEEVSETYRIPPDLAETIAPGTWMQHIDDCMPRLKAAGTEFITGHKLSAITPGIIGCSAYNKRKYKKTAPGEESLPERHADYFISFQREAFPLPSV